MLCAQSTLLHSDFVRRFETIQQLRQREKEARYDLMARCEG